MATTHPDPTTHHQPAGPAASPDVDHPSTTPADATTEPTGFQVSLDGFSGPFDVLLGLISARKMDVTEVALGAVTDDFIDYMKQHHGDFDLDEASQFVLVAATLLDLKAARLIPGAAVEDEDDLALLDARDLLFARLLQYRAYKDITSWFRSQLHDQATKHPSRPVPQPEHIGILPELTITFGPERLGTALARMVARRLGNPAETVATDHVHAPPVSVREQAHLILRRIRDAETVDFTDLITDATTPMLVAARFLATLELYRQRVVDLTQQHPFGPLAVQWSGNDDADINLDALGADFDDPEPADDAQATATDASAAPPDQAAIADPATVEPSDQPATGSRAAAQNDAIEQASHD